MRRIVYCLSIMLVFSVAPAFSNISPSPSDSEVKVALQSILVAGAATSAAGNLVPPLIFAESILDSDSSLANFQLTLDNADVGLLRKTVLESPQPPPRQMGFLEALFTAVIPLVPDYARMVEFLKPQGLLEEEVILSGTVEAVRLSYPYPFRYEGIASLEVSGSRFSQPFSLDVTFVIPLEGPAGSAIIPLRVTANGTDYLHVARALFKIPAGVDIESQLQLIL